MTLLAVDPALAGYSGVALFDRTSQTLIKAGRTKGDDHTDWCYTDRCKVVAVHIINFAWQEARIPTSVVVEWPQIYKASKSEGDPNDLIPLAAIGAMVVMTCAEAIRRVNGIELVSRSPTPKQWSGGIPKTDRRGKLPKDAWSSPRGKRIWSVLSEAERALVPNSHDAIDAVGIGLWALGRLAPVRVYPGT